MGMQHDCFEPGKYFSFDLLELLLLFIQRSVDGFLNCPLLLCGQIKVNGIELHEIVWLVRTDVIIANCCSKHYSVSILVVIPSQFRFNAFYFSLLFYFLYLP